jgi:uncharacterized damage-inducible protein DinB
MNLTEILIAELSREASTTRRVLERVPDERLSWRPHPKARTLGALAMHVAMVPGAVAQLGCRPSPAQLPQFADEPAPKSAAEFVPALDRSLATVKSLLGRMDDASATETWRLMKGDRELFAIPRIAFLRSVMLNHWYHHRGQLTAYLRELDVPIPSIYGPSGDEQPFA